MYFQTRHYVCGKFKNETFKTSIQKKIFNKRKFLLTKRRGLGYNLVKTRKNNNWLEKYGYETKDKIRK